jgi:hypothetical protein
MMRGALAELRLYSRRHRVAGTCDTIGFLQGQIVLIDVKTEVDPVTVAADYQTGAYGGLFLEMQACGYTADALTFEPLSHTYTLDGCVVPSVTQVLKRAGFCDFSHVQPTILEANQQRGTAVHKAICYYNQNDLPGDFDRQFPTLAPYLAAWIAFVRESGYIQAYEGDLLQRLTHLQRYAVSLKGTGRYVVHRFEAPTDYGEFLQLLHAQQLVDRRRRA